MRLQLARGVRQRRVDQQGQIRVIRAYREGNLLIRAHGELVLHPPL